MRKNGQKPGHGQFYATNVTMTDDEQPELYVFDSKRERDQFVIEHLLIIPITAEEAYQINPQI